MGTEDEYTVARVEESLAEELLEDLRTRTRNDVLGGGGYVELLLHEARCGLPEFGDAR